MKNLFILALVSISLSATAQVGIGTSTPAASSQLDLTSTSRGLLVPRMTAVQKTAISSPATGLLIYQTDAPAGFYCYSGSAWLILNAGAVSLTNGNIFIGNASNVAASVTVSGDITITNGGVTAIGSGVIVNADISASAAIADTKLATISTASKVANSATTAVSTNTVNAIVARDGSGNFSAGTITANLTGNVTGNTSGSAATLATGRTISTTGDVAYTSGSFNGSADVTGTATLAATGVTAGTYSKVTVDAKGRVTAGAAISSTEVNTALGFTPTQIRELSDEATATASQTAFTLSQTPSANSKVKMFINGIRISKNAYSVSAATLTYVPASNGAYALTAGDRIQFEYYY